MAHAGLPVRDEPERERATRPGLPNRGRWISAAQTPAPDVPPAAPERRPRSSRCWGSNAVVWTTDITQRPRDQAIELLAWMAPAHIAVGPPAGNTPDDNGRDGPWRMAARPMASPARATHTGSRRCQARPPRGSQQGSARHRLPRPRTRDPPAHVIGNQFKQVHKWQICVYASADDRAPEPQIIGDLASRCVLIEVTHRD